MKHLLIIFFFCVCIYSCNNSQALFKKSMSIDHIKELNTVSDGFVSVKGDVIKYERENYWRFICKNRNQVVFDGYFNLKEDTLFLMPYHSVYQGCFDKITFYVLKKRGILDNSCKINHPNITLIDSDVYFSYVDTISRKGVFFERFEHQLMINDDYAGTSGSSIITKRNYSINLNEGIFLDSIHISNNLDFYWFGY